MSTLIKNGTIVTADRTYKADVLIEGEVAEEILWLDDLMELLKQLGAVPAFVGGSSAGARTAMRFAPSAANALARASSGRDSPSRRAASSQ